MVEAILVVEVEMVRPCPEPRFGLSSTARRMGAGAGIAGEGEVVAPDLDGELGENRGKGDHSLNPFFGLGVSSDTSGEGDGLFSPFSVSTSSPSSGPLQVNDSSSSSLALLLLLFDASFFLRLYDSPAQVVNPIAARPSMTDKAIDAPRPAFVSLEFGVGDAVGVCMMDGTSSGRLGRLPLLAISILGLSHPVRLRREAIPSRRAGAGSHGTVKTRCGVGESFTSPTTWLSEVSSLTSNSGRDRLKRVFFDERSRSHRSSTAIGEKGFLGVLSYTVGGRSAATTEKLLPMPMDRGPDLRGGITSSVASTIGVD